MARKHKPADFAVTGETLTVPPGWTPEQKAPRRIRCSALPIIMQCGPAAQSPEVRVETSGPEAALGRAVHAVLAEIVRAGLEQVPDLESYAQAHRLREEDRDALRSLAWAGLNAWKELRGEVELRGVEVELQGQVAGCTLTGHADIVGRTDAGPIVLDWKSGYRDADYLDQLRGYLRLAWDMETDSAPVGKVGVIWLRERRIEIADVARVDLLAWEARLAEALASSAFSPGEQCTYCGRRLECPGRLALVRSVVAELTPAGDLPSFAALPVERLAELYPRTRLLAKALDLYDDALREAVAAAGVPVPIGDGRALSLEDARRETVLPERAIDDLIVHLDMSAAELRAALADEITCSKKAVEDLAASRAKRGAKGTARSEVIDLLRGVDGALRVTEFKKLTAKKEG